ncbi:ferritin-like domain-containing protein [Paenisporosarcina cavernae]|uniref:Ferritin-like domain-containing protein n=1 Tax=Paenisporosarcina cavernae TaxID=2320858 RepID=A0A385YU32_9BACL|nr:ferritin-like domain-containing protein [Paenisporosarcina cavernae]AYC30186.1 ferritin-like domain-containing protein [Paenisporosarcina cavernae]
MFIIDLEKAIHDEYHDYYTYKYLEKMTDNTMFQHFINHAKEDERTHYEMFQQLYYMLTGRFVQNLVKPDKPTNFHETVKKSLENELHATDFYKEMFLEIPIPQAYAPMFIAMHDEMEHAIRFSTIYNARQ